MQRSSPLGNMMGGEMTPATPAATKYAGLFAGIFAIAGVICLVKASKASEAAPAETASE